MCPCSTRSLTCSPNKARRHRRSVVVFRLHHAPQNLHRSWKPRPRMESALLLQMLPLDLARLRHIPQRIRGGVVVCDPWSGVGRGGCGRVAAAAPLEGVRKGDQRVIFASQGVLQAGAKAPSAGSCAEARAARVGGTHPPARAANRADRRCRLRLELHKRLAVPATDGQLRRRLLQPRQRSARRPRLHLRLPFLVRQRSERQHLLVPHRPRLSATVFAEPLGRRQARCQQHRGSVRTAAANGSAAAVPRATGLLGPGSAGSSPSPASALRRLACRSAKTLRLDSHSAAPLT